MRIVSGWLLGWALFLSTLAQGAAPDLARLRELAGQGEADAQHQLGQALRTGKDVPRDDAEACSWFARAAQQGHAAAQNGLGLCYRSGQGVAMDQAEAQRWFEKAAAQRYASGEFNLAYGFENGLGTAADLEAARSHYAAAAALGNGAARERLDDFDRLHEELVRITVPADGYFDRERQIVASVFRPDGAGPFPVLVLSHGSPPVAEDRKKMGLALQLEPAREFVRRGYLVIAPVRRGYGLTGGDYAENYRRCTAAEFYQAGMQAAREVIAALEFARRRPDAAPEGAVLAGQSAGGFASLAAAALNPAGVRYVFNFSGGRGGDPAHHPGVPCGEGEMAGAFARFGAATRIPVLFHYVENDQFFAPAYTRSWFAAFERAGGKGRYVLQPPFGKDGHGMIAAKAALPTWTRAVDEFISAY